MNLPLAPALPPAPRIIGLSVALLLSAAILLGGRVPDAVELFAFSWDKLQHALAYAVLAGSWCVAFGGRRVVLSIMIAVGTGALDEWLQRALPGRQADLADLLADAVGATIGAWLAAMLAARVWQRLRMAVAARG